MKHECISVNTFLDNDLSKKIEAEKWKDSTIENTLTAFEGYSMCLLDYSS